MLAELRGEQKTIEAQPSIPRTLAVPKHCDSELGRAFSSANEPNLFTFMAALKYVSPDALRGNGSLINPDGSPANENWLGVILAGRREFGDAVKEPLREW